MERRINRLSAVMYLSEKIQAIEIKPEKVYHPLHTANPFLIPLKSCIVPAEENDFKLNHFLDYSNAHSKEEDIEEVYANHPAQRKILSAIEHAVSLIAEIVAEKGIEKTLIKIQIASDKEPAALKIERTGNPHFYRHTRHRDVKLIGIKD